MKKILIKIRASIKLLILISIATFFIVGAFVLLYKPIYSVNFEGELIGYCSQKSKLQTKIDEYIENGDKQSKNVAFVQLESMPTYDLCLLKRGITTNDDEIFEKIITSGVPYYKYYAILEDDEEKLCVSDFKTAEEIVQGLKDKDSDNIENITIIEKYETELADFIEAETAIAGLYKEKPKVISSNKVASTSNKNKTSNKAKSTGSTSGFSTSANLSKNTVQLGVALIKPVTGVITSRFGAISGIRSGAHTGLDIGASTGTAVKAAASGTVIYSGYKGSLGNLVVISHSNGVQTYYGHCSKLYVSAGQTVSQGEKICAVGSTGNSTGPHLHFEIRVNGVAYNPQRYVY